MTRPAVRRNGDDLEPETVLSDSQQSVVAHGSGPCLVIAGPGSGKTRTVVERLLHLAGEGVPLDAILVLTYTVPAAAEMLSRARASLPAQAEPRLLNFHTFSRSLLYEHAHRLGLSRHWRRVTTPELWLIARDILSDWRPPYIYNPLQPWGLIGPLLAAVEQAKQELVDPASYSQWAQEQAAAADASADPERYDLLRRHSIVAEFYQRLEVHNRALGVLTYDDQILFAERLLRENPEAVSAMTGQVRYVMVDEFQDTNFAQSRLVEALVAAHGNLMVIADDDQSIYKFRGASLANLERFARLFPGHRTIVLNENFRSTPEIVRATRAVISEADANARRPKDLVSARPTGAAVQLWHALDELSECTAIARECKRLTDECGIPPDQVAWLFARHDDMVPAIRALQAAEVPYQVLGGRGFFNQPELQALMALLHAVHDPDDSQAVIRTLRLPLWRVSSRGRALLVDAMRRDDTPFVRQVVDGDTAGRLEGMTLEDLSAVTRAASQLLDLHVLSQSTDVVSVVIEALHASGYLDIPALTKSIESAQAIANVQKFQHLLEDFCEFSVRDNRLTAALAYLEAVRLTRSEDALGAIDAPANAVKLMTCHASKGLEFASVFISHCAEFRWPGRGRGRPLFSIPDDLIEEPAPVGDVWVDESRRLLYVAMTRAKDRLVLSFADRYGGSFRNRDELVSPFVAAAAAAAGWQTSRPDLTAPALSGRRAVPGNLLAADVEPNVHDLIAFRTCPRQYQYRAIWRMPVRPEPRQWFGTLLHNVLERAGRLRMAGEEVRTDQLVTMWEEEWRDAPRLYLRGEHPGLRQHGATLLRQYAQTSQWLDGQIVDVERGFLIARARVRGRFDRVDVGPDGRPIIVDYKTGTPPADPDRMKSDIQVRAYAVQIADESDVRLATVDLHYMEDSTNIRVQFDEAALRTARGQIGAVADEIREAIRTDHFPMRPSDWNCSHCPYATVCPKGVSGD